MSTLLPTLSPTNPADVIPFIAELCKGAGVVHMKHFRKLSGYDHKGEIDLVTIADKESEALVVARILERFPDHAILGEEGGRLGAAQSDWLWIIDPLDGTTNFAHGLRLFGVSIGLTYRGEPVAGGILAPALDELYLTARGAGATCNGDRIAVSKTLTLADSLIVTGFPYDRVALIKPLMSVMAAALCRTRGVTRFGAASWDYACVASGRLEAFYEYGLKPWDMAAGVLLVAEAGGRVTGLLPGEPFDLFKPRAIASNGLIHDELATLIADNGGRDFPTG